MTQKIFWEPWRYRWGGEYPCQYNNYKRDISMLRKFKSGKEREEFIRQQSQLIRSCSTEDEYLDLYYSILTLTS